MDPNAAKIVDSTANDSMQPQLAQKRPIDMFAQVLSNGPKRQRKDGEDQPDALQKLQQPASQPLVQPQLPPTAQQQAPMYVFRDGVFVPVVFPTTSAPSDTNCPPSALDTFVSSLTTVPPPLTARSKASARPAPRERGVTKIPAKISDDKEVFRELPLPSLLSISDGAVKKMKVLVGEIRRRVEAPEYLEVEQIAPLARYVTKLYPECKRNMVSHGFDLEANKGKEKASGILTSLLEEDALILARDFNMIVSNELSTPLMAEFVVKCLGEDAPSLVKQIPSIRDQLLRVRTHLLSAGRLPTDLTTALKKGSLDPAVKDFALFTHGLGPLVTVAIVDSIMKVLTGMEKIDLDEMDFNISSSSLDNSLIDSSFQESESETSLVAREDDNVVYCKVVPRIVFDGKPIDVSLGELRRRVFGPEKFTLCMMNSFLRKVKRANTIAALRDSLAAKGMELYQIKTSANNSCSWASLTESEATALSTQTAQHLSKLPSPQAMNGWATTNRKAAESLSRIAFHMQYFMERAHILSGEGRSDTEKMDKNLNKFALMTHYFGHTFFTTVLKWIQTKE